VVLACALLPTPASGAIRWSRFDTARFPPLTDGARWAYYYRPTGELRVVDFATGRARTETIPERCGVDALGSGQLLITCRRTNGPKPDEVIVRDLKTGLERRPNLDRVPVITSSSFGGASFYAVGRRWIAGESTAYHEFQRFFLNVDTGDVGYRDPGPRSVLDLDRPGLATLMCAPFARRPDPDFTQDPYADRWLRFDYTPPYGLSGLPTKYPAPGWEVKRCGRPRPILICRKECDGGPQLGGGIVTWFQTGFGRNVTTFAYELAHRRLAKKNFIKFGYAATFSHAGRWLIYSDELPSEGFPRPWRIRVAKLPR
jgi:hypothetical protein